MAPDDHARFPAGGLFGEDPRLFHRNHLSTDRDEYGWRQFWSDRGFQLDEVGFTAFHGELADLSKIDSLVNHRVRPWPAPFSKWTRSCTESKWGAPGMAAQVKIWTGNGFICALIQRFLAQNFHVVISSDHGNVEAQGIGTPKEGSLSETKGERCRIYCDAKLRASALLAFPETIAWDHQGLPKNFHCLLAPQGKAFLSRRDRRSSATAG